MRILLVDDHALFLEGLHNLLFARGMEVVGTARDGLEALHKVREVCPDIILMDIRMPRCDGLAATRLIKAECPEVRIVILTTSDDENDLFEALLSGACGYLLKSLDADTLVNYLQGIMTGEAVITGPHASSALHTLACQAARSEQTKSSPGEQENPLTARQLEILQLVAQGLSYKEVAREVNLSERTIKYHMGEITRTLNRSNREQAVAYALQIGLVRGAPDSFDR